MRHICYPQCDISHKIWLENHSDDPILDGEVIHHKDGDHDNNEDSNQEKMTIAEHISLHQTGNKNWLGKNHTKKSKRKISISNIGKKLSIETKRKISIAKSGINCSKETRIKLSAAKLGENNPLYGVSHSEETKKKMSKSKLGNINWLGKKHSKETKVKMSTAQSGKNHPLYGKRGKDNPNYGRKCSEETKNKIRLAMLGKKQTNIKMKVEECSQLWL